jgi:hypothetical protein
MSSLALAKTSFESLTSFSSFLALKLAVGIEVELLILNNVVIGNITLLCSAEVGLYAFRVVAESSQKLFS